MGSLNNQTGVLCIGSIMVDILCPVDAIPAPGQGVIADGYRQALGGCAFNTANAIRLAGGKTRLIAPVGTGPYAAFVQYELAKRGMDVLHIEGGSDNGAAICLVQPDGERTMITLPGIERLGEPYWLQSIDTTGYGFVEVCGYEIGGVGGDLIIDFLEQHPELEIWFAPGPSVAQIDTERIGRLISLQANWHLNAAEVCAFTDSDSLEAAGAEMAEQCGVAVVVTDGAHGSHAFEHGKHYYATSHAIHAIDTTGAGDFHLGAVLAQRAKGADWLSTLQFANRMGEAVCQVMGAALTDEQYASMMDTK
ncbi:MAG: carbohydrate kinase family protein [Eggerthellaceae bacterium]|nr:carbohydrate kinase family protein [Eggerthellaceae bacterium]